MFQSRNAGGFCLVEGVLQDAAIGRGVLPAVLAQAALEAEALHQRVFLVATETGQTVQRGAIVGPLAVVAEQLGLGNRRLRPFVMIIAAIRRRWERRSEERRVGKECVRTC